MDISDNINRMYVRNCLVQEEKFYKSFADNICWEKFFIGVSIFHFYYGNVPWKLHLAINVNTPMQFLSLLNVIKIFHLFLRFFFAIVCAVQAQELGLCLTGKTCRRWRQCHSSTWGPKCWPKYGISLRSVVLVGS